VDLIHLPQDRIKGRALVNTAVNVWFEVFAAVGETEVGVFWVVGPCSLVVGKRFGGRAADASPW
jgi:hypothetical protein